MRSFSTKQSSLCSCYASTLLAPMSAGYDLLTTRSLYMYICQLGLPRGRFINSPVSVALLSCLDLDAKLQKR